MDELVTLKSADFEANLAIAKSFLIDNGIDCVVNGEYLTVNTAGLGTARLQVRSEDYRRAAELLIEGGFAKREDFDFEKYQ